MRNIEEDETIENWPNSWWSLCRAVSLERGRPLGLTRLGQRLVLWRDADGRACAAHAACPHRGTDLSMGQVRDGEIVCAYHGFCFSREGSCRTIPCEGPDAKIPPRLRLSIVPLLEAHGFIFGYLGSGEPPAFHWVPEAPAPSSSQGSREMIWPVRLSRVVEAMLDIHHLGIAHRYVMPPGYLRLDPYEAHFDEQGILRSTGRLRKEGRPDSGWVFHMDLAPPAQLCLRLTSAATAIVVCTPIDAEHTWIGLRYQVSVPWLGALPLVNRLASELGIAAEMWLVQPDDLRMIENAAPRSGGIAHGQLVHSDKAIALWHAWRERATRELCTLEEASDAPQPVRSPGTGSP